MTSDQWDEHWFRIREDYIEQFGPRLGEETT